MWLKLNRCPKRRRPLRALGMELPQVQSMLDTMMAKGQWHHRLYMETRSTWLCPLYRIYEFQVNRLDKELSQLVAQLRSCLDVFRWRLRAAITRVVPVNAQIQVSMRYTDTKTQDRCSKGQSFQLLEGLCRKPALSRIRPCKHTLEVCLAFLSARRGFEQIFSRKFISER